MIFVSVNVHVSVVEHQHEIETKNKILDPCIALDAPNSCDTAGDCTENYVCVNNDGIASCSAGSDVLAGTKCDGGAIQDVCDANGSCVGKKIFIAFRIKHLSW